MRLNSLQTKILAGTIGIVLAVGAAAAVIIQTTVRQKLYAALQQRGSFMAMELANESATPLLTRRIFDLEMLLRDLKASDNDIEYYFVVNSAGAVIAHTFGSGFPSDLKAMGGDLHVWQPRMETLVTEKGEVLDFAAPIMEGRIGTVHVGIAKRPMEEEVDSLRMLLVLTILSVMVVGSIAAFVFARTVTVSVRQLVGAAQAVGHGDLDQRIEIRTGDEIGELAASFQEMIEKRKRVEHDREALIVQLKNAVENIKTLKGLLPICANCKKIRDDKGYWSQIEAYVREHSEAEFSHSICPDCAKKIYPQYFKE